MGRNPSRLPVPTQVIARRRREASGRSKWCLPDIERGADKFRLYSVAGARVSTGAFVASPWRRGKSGRSGDQGQPVEMSDG